MFEGINQIEERREVSHSKLRITSNIFVLIMLALWTVVNLFQGAYTDLSADESYYYVLSQNPSWGYFDHPPMNMWLIFLSTGIFGNSELGIRLLTILLQPVYLYLFWLTIKTERSHMRSALTFILLAVSMPMLQIWGWVSTPDAPLMMFSILLLWAYKRFLESNSLSDALLMGVSVALLGYSKYHGALFLVFLLASNRRLFLSWKFWIGMILAAVLFFPHIYWQYMNDWVSFRYHLSGRTNSFEWENFWIYIINLLTTFNPFLVVVLIAFMVKGALPSRDDVGRSMKWIMWGFLLFFLWSVRNVHVQAQWLILVSFPVMYFIFVASETRPYLKHYVNVLGVWMLVVFGVARVVLIAAPADFLRFDMHGSKPVYKEFAQKLDSIPFIGNSNYQFSSKLAYYGDIDTYGRPSLDCRSSHYEFLDMEDSYKGKTVAVEISQYAMDEHRKGIPLSDTLISQRTEKKIVLEPKKHVVKLNVQDTSIIRRNYHYDTILGYEIVWDTIQNYLPMEKVSIKASGFPSKIHSADIVIADFEVSNPYDYDIPIEGPFSYKLYMNVRYGRFSSFLMWIGWSGNQKYLPAKSLYKFKKEIHFPEMIPSGTGTYGFTIARLPYGSWYNSNRYNITITNVKNIGGEEKQQLFR